MITTAAHRFVRACLLLSLINLAGCASERGAYASKHPELSKEHRQIMLLGKIPSGYAVAGLTREQVRIAMGGYPDTFDKANGQDAWIYYRKKTGVSSPDEADLSRFNATAQPTEPSRGQIEPGSPLDATAKTIIYFQGDRATRAETSDQ